MDDKLTIRVNIVYRYYPLKIDRKDEEKIRRATKKINKVSKLLQFEFLFHSKAFLQKKIDILHQNLLTKKKYAKFRWFL